MLLEVWLQPPSFDPLRFAIDLWHTRRYGLQSIFSSFSILFPKIFQHIWEKKSQTCSILFSTLFHIKKSLQLFIKVLEQLDLLTRILSTVFLKHFSLNQHFSHGVAMYSCIFLSPMSTFPGLSLANTGHMTSRSYEVCWLMKGLKICQPNSSFS